MAIENMVLIDDEAEGLRVVDRPISADDLTGGGSGYIDVVVPFGLDDLIDADGMDAFDDMLDERIVSGCGILGDISYSVAGVADGAVLVRVSAFLDV